MYSTKFKIESGMQLLTRLIRKSKIGNFYPHLFQTCPTNGDIIEISCESGSPLVIDMISEVLVPYTLQGKDTGIIYFNTDGNLNYDLLLNVIRNKLLLHTVKPEIMATEFNAEEKFQEILNKFHVLEISDATQFCTTLHNLENILMQHSNISLLIFDTLTAFYWSEQGFKITKMDFYLKNLLQTIKKVNKEYKVTCIYTRPHYFNSNKDVDHIESWMTETLKYRIKIIKCDKHFEVNVKTNEIEYIKHFKILDGEIKWL